MTKWTSGVLYVTKDPIDQIEDWLDANCKGPWKTELVSIDDSLPGQFLKELKILFTDADDTRSFKSTFMASDEEQKDNEAARVEGRKQRATEDAQKQTREIRAAAAKKAKLAPGMLQIPQTGRDWRSKN
jgi:hypothetical protein